MVGDIPDDLTRKAVDVLLRCVAVLIQIPIRVLVVLVVTVPVGVFAVAGLVVLQPFLVVGSGQRHEVLTDVALRITQSRTVLHVLMRIIGGEVEVDRTCRRSDTQIKVVTTHVSVGENILVAHVGEAEAHARLTAVNTQNSSVLCSKTGTEEGAGIVLIHGEGTLYAVEVLHQLVVGLRTPAHVGTRSGSLAELAAVTHTVDLLDVVPLCVLHINSH